MIPTAGKATLEAAKRVMNTAKGKDTFELKLLVALMKMFPCEGGHDLN
jgi:hypothetical protein